jgi:hypothetical protein
MSLYNAKNVFHMFVGKNVAGPADATLIDSYADLNDGAIGLVDTDNVVHETTTGAAIDADKSYRFVQRNGTTLLYSPFFVAGKIFGAASAGYSQPIQQVTFLGYAGSGTDDFEVIDDTNYVVNSAATAAEIAIGLTDSLVLNFKREAHKYIQFDAVCNVAVDANFDITNNVTIVNGLDYIDVAANLTYDTANGTLAVGDFIRIADDSFNGTLDLTDPVYKVVKIDTLRVWLDRPITNASGTWTDAGDGTQVIPAATGVAAQWGIAMRGLAQTWFVAGTDNYFVVKFDVGGTNLGSTPITYTTAAYEGRGNEYQMREMLWFAQGNMGKRLRLGVPPPTSIDTVTASGTYETLSFKWYHDAGESIVGTDPKSFGEIMIANYVNATTGDLIFATLDELSNVTLTAW